MSTVTTSKQYAINPTQLEFRVEPSMPAGICGRMVGVALVYGVVDSYNTTFMRGCLDKTRNERLAAGKVKLFADHMNMTSAHVGVVRALDDVGDAVVMTAEIFDTEDGRKMKEYLQAVMAARAETGLSVGFMPRRGGPSPMDPMVYEFQEIELREVSITPMSAVPGTDVTGVRMQLDEELDESSADEAVEHAVRAMLEVMDKQTAARVIAKLYSEVNESASRHAASGVDVAPAPVDMPSADAMTSDSADATVEAARASAKGNDGPSVASMEQRMAALRASFRM